MTSLQTTERQHLVQLKHTDARLSVDYTFAILRVVFLNNALRSEDSTSSHAKRVEKIKLNNPSIFPFRPMPKKAQCGSLARAGLRPT